MRLRNPDRILHWVLILWTCIRCCSTFGVPLQNHKLCSLDPTLLWSRNVWPQLNQRTLCVCGGLTWWRVYRSRSWVAASLRPFAALGGDTGFFILHKATESLRPLKQPLHMSLPITELKIIPSQRCGSVTRFILVIVLIYNEIMRTRSWVEPNLIALAVCVWNGNLLCFA